VTRWPLLDAIPAADQERVLSAARRRQFRRGQAVFREGDPADSMHLIEDGVFAVEVSTPSGDRSMVNVLAPGAFFGELSLVTPALHARRTASVIALSAGQTLALSASAFAALRQTSPEVERLLVAALAQRVDELSGQLLEALYAGVNARLYRRLCALADLFADGDGSATIPLTQEDLATMVGASRPTVNQLLQRLVSDEVIALGRRQIAIRDIAALRALAEA
jgi:CRP/FNR family transcriptional regulator, cyclic AMP receptor protein